MSDIKWDIYLLGETQLGVERSTLVRNLATVFKKDVPVIEKMLRKPRSLLKADVDLATANKYKMVIDKAGGLCELVEHGEQLFPSDALSPAAARPALSVVPIETPAPAADADNSLLPYTVSPYDAPQSEVNGPSLFCFKCGAGLYAGMTQCPKCLTQQPQFNHKNKVTAGILAFFLGGLGVHRFYLGQWWGIFYLLFWGTLIPSIISFIEAFVFWCTSDERWNEKYGHVSSRGSNMAIVLVVGIFLFISVIGILAAIALPAYQDYTMRSKIAAGMPLVNETRVAVEKVIHEKDFFPSENILAGLPENISNQYVQSIQLDEGAQIVVTYNATLGGNKSPTIIWKPNITNGRITWDCTGGEMPNNMRNTECRSGAEASPLPDSARSDGSTLKTTPPLEKPARDGRIYSDDKKVSFTVPAGWEMNRQLNANALLGVANIDNENSSYVIAMAESKESLGESIDAAVYLSLVVENLQAGSSEFNEIEPAKTVVVNNRPAQQQTIALNYKDEKVAYLLTTLETDTDLYVIYAWTIESHYQNNRALLKKVSESFVLHQ